MSFCCHSNINSLGHQITLSNQEIQNKNSTKTQFLAEWIVNPETLIKSIDEAINENLILDIIRIAVEYLHNPDPQTKYIFGPERWIKEYKDQNAVPEYVLKSILIDTIHLNHCKKAGSIVFDYLNNDFLVSESTFFTGNEESDNKLKQTMPNSQQEALLQSNDPFFPGKKVEENALRLFLPSHFYGKNLTSIEALMLLNDLKYKIDTPQGHHFFLLDFISKCNKRLSNGGNAFLNEKESVWLIRAIPQSRDSLN